MAKPSPDHSAIILDLHIGQGMSLRAIERSHGLANGILSRFARINNIPVRSKREQIRLGFATGAQIPKSGSDHWSYGMTKETSAIHRRHSERMTAHNPSKDPEILARALETKRKNGFNAYMSDIMRGRIVSDKTRKKLAKSLAVIFAEQITYREKLMLRALAFDDRWVFQHATDYHILDFAWPALKVAFEVDNGGHKLQRSAKRDGILVDSGWTIFRVRYDLADDPSYFNRLFRIAEYFIPDFHCPDKYPSSATHVYRVVVRCPENHAGIHVDDPDDPAFIDLAGRIRNRLESVLVRQD